MPHAAARLHSQSPAGTRRQAPGSSAFRSRTAKAMMVTVYTTRRRPRAAWVLARAAKSGCSVCTALHANRKAQTVSAATETARSDRRSCQPATRGLYDQVHSVMDGGPRHAKRLRRPERVAMPTNPKRSLTGMARSNQGAVPSWRGVPRCWAWVGEVAPSTLRRPHDRAGDVR